ncbi:MAG TPA: AarF/UbiB family protein, partial [Candidatus Obscuribacterales bacterium]
MSDQDSDNRSAHTELLPSEAHLAPEDVASFVESAAPPASLPASVLAAKATLPPLGATLPAEGGKVYRWNRKRYSRTKRTVDIWSFVFRFLGARWLYKKPWSYAGEMTPDKLADRRRRQAIWIRETFLELGPTFIKLGQLFSTRADLFPIEYVEELSKLQVRVPAFSYEQVEEIITADLGKSIPALYKSFDPIPLAAASLGQVHRAQLHSGEEVVV